MRCCNHQFWIKRTRTLENAMKYILSIENYLEWYTCAHGDLRNIRTRLGNLGYWDGLPRMDPVRSLPRREKRVFRQFSNYPRKKAEQTIIHLVLRALHPCRGDVRRLPPASGQGPGVRRLPGAGVAPPGTIPLIHRRTLHLQPTCLSTNCTLGGLRPQRHGVLPKLGAEFGGDLGVFIWNCVVNFENKSWKPQVLAQICHQLSQ